MQTTRMATLWPDPDGNGLPYGRILYNDRGIAVTENWFVAHGQHYPMAELQHLRIMATARSGLVLGASLFAVAVAIAVARVWSYLDTDGWVGALTVLAALVALAVIGNRLHRRLHCLIGDYHGMTVLLVWEDDGTRFGKITRAVQRARETHGLSKAIS